MGAGYCLEQIEILASGLGFFNLTCDRGLLLSFIFCTGW